MVTSKEEERMDHSPVRITVESFSHALRAVIPSCIILDVPTRMGDEALLYSERWWGEPVKLRMEHGLRQLLQPTA